MYKFFSFQQFKLEKLIFNFVTLQSEQEIIINSIMQNLASNFAVNKKFSNFHKFSLLTYDLFVLIKTMLKIQESIFKKFTKNKSKYLHDSL